jgi:CDGSH-type Zn-finger protein
MNQEPDAPDSRPPAGCSPPNRQRPRIKLSRDGPYLVTLDDLTNSKGERLDARHGIALCRCGASKRKPFCDSSHIRIGFSGERRADRAPSAMPESADPGQRVPDDVAAPSIRIARNGPYEVQGCDLDTDAWSEGASRERFALCRCGGSRNKPFCDGSHRTIGFEDDRN